MAAWWLRSRRRRRRRRVTCTAAAAAAAAAVVYDMHHLHRTHSASHGERLRCCTRGAKGGGTAPLTSTEYLPICSWWSSSYTPCGASSTLSVCRSSSAPRLPLPSQAREKGSERIRTAAPLRRERQRVAHSSSAYRMARIPTTCSRHGHPHRSGGSVGGAVQTPSDLGTLCGARTRCRSRPTCSLSHALCSVSPQSRGEGPRRASLQPSPSRRPSTHLELRIHLALHLACVGGGEHLIHHSPCILHQFGSTS